MSAEDREDIRNVLALYAHVIDNQEWDRIGEVYAADGSYGPRDGTPNVGHEAIVKYLASVHQPEVHSSSNHHIEVDAGGESGTGRGKWVVVFPSSRVVAGDYDDTYVKTDAGWRIKDRRSFVRAR
jgi:hypothetical protein